MAQLQENMSLISAKRNAARLRKRKSRDKLKREANAGDVEAARKVKKINAYQRAFMRNKRRFEMRYNFVLKRLESTASNVNENSLHIAALKEEVIELQRSKSTDVDQTTSDITNLKDEQKSKATEIDQNTSDILEVGDRIRELQEGYCYLKKKCREAQATAMLRNTRN